MDFVVVITTIGLMSKADWILSIYEMRMNDSRADI